MSLQGLPTGDFLEALPVLLGEATSGQSPSNISRQNGVRETEIAVWQTRHLSDVDSCYSWADGVHTRVRLSGPDRLGPLVLIAIRPDGTRDLLATEHGYRESVQSWTHLLPGLKRRGLRAPALVVSDGALYILRAVGDVWPGTREQGETVHRMGNVLDKLARQIQGVAQVAMGRIVDAPTHQPSEQGIDRFEVDSCARCFSAVAFPQGDEDQFLSFFHYTAEHLKRLGTWSPLEPTFATIQLRQRVTEGLASGVQGLTMALEMIELAHDRWRWLNGLPLLTVVRTRVQFTYGEQVEHEDKR